MRCTGSRIFFVSIILFSLFSGCVAFAQHSLLFTGTYTDGKPDKGIYIFSLNEVTGQLTLLNTGENVTNPSYLTVSPDGKWLFACTDTKTLVAGSVSAFTIDSANGSIHFINKVSSTGANPVYVSVDKKNRFVAVANYTEGNAAIFKIKPGGELEPAIQQLQFSGSSIIKERQDKPHIHSANFSPDNNYIFLPDLGTDKIRAFKFNAGNDSVVQAMEQLNVKAEPGFGPRHMAFHPNKKWAYCITEMGGAVLCFNYKAGELSLFQTINGNEKTASAYSSADIHISQDGLFLYCSNRVENTIGIFSIDKNGHLRLLGHQPSGGEAPRNFTIDPSGKFLLVANQASNNIVVFRRDTISGLLYETGYTVTVPQPSCLQIRKYNFSR